MCHDGVFHLLRFLECDADFGTEDLKGVPYPWGKLDELEKWDPARPDLLNM